MEGVVPGRLATTIVGVPVTWLVMLLVQFVVSLIGAGLELGPDRGRVLLRCWRLASRRPAGRIGHSLDCSLLSAGAFSFAGCAVSSGRRRSARVELPEGRRETPWTTRSADGRVVARWCARLTACPRHYVESGDFSCGQSGSRYCGCDSTFAASFC